MNSTEELNQYNQALNALQSIENQFDLNVDEFLADDDVVGDGQDGGTHSPLYFDTSLYQTTSPQPSQMYSPNTNVVNQQQLLHTAHTSMIQQNKMIQNYLNNMGQQQVRQKQNAMPVNPINHHTLLPTSRPTGYSQMHAVAQPKPNGSALTNFGNLIPSIGSGSSQSYQKSQSIPIAQQSSRDSASSSGSSVHPSSHIFPSMDKGIHAVQQVIVNGGISSIQVWSNCLMHLIPVLKIIDDTIPDTVIGGKSVSNRKKTPLGVSIEVSLDRFRMLVSTIISLVRQRHSILEKEGEAFCQVSEKLNLMINLDDLRLKVQRNEIAFSDDLWRADVSLLMNGQEQDKGLTRDKPKKKKNENIREGFSVLSNPENPATTIIQYSPIKAGIVSNNKKNCQLRYKLCYDNWLVYYVDSTKLFAINCGKNTKSKRKSKAADDGTKDETQDEIELDALSNGEHSKSSSSPLPADTTTSAEVASISRSASTGSLNSLEKPQTIALAANGSFIVSPKSGSNQGGYFIFIQFTFDSKLISDPQQLKVFMGNKEAEVQQINDNAIFVVAPKTEQVGEVAIEIRTNNFTVSNPNDLKFEFVGEPNANGILVNEKKRKYDCCDTLSESSFSRTASQSSFTPSLLPVSKPEKKKRKEVQTPYRREWAIVIAIDKYSHNGLLHESAASSVHDAMNIANILTKIYGFEVRVLLNEEATWMKVNQLFVSLAESDSLQNDDAILIFFTGVSISKQYINGYTENYLALYDTDPDNLVNTAISHQSFVNFHHRLAAKHILFIFDTFYNGIMMKVVNDGHTSKGMKYYSANKAVQMICSSQKSSALKPGVFSKELVNLLTTMKWGNEGIKSGHLTLTPFYTTSDLGKQLQAKVHKETNGVQVPRFGDIELGGGNFLFIPKSYEKHSYNSELERIVSLLSLYEDYIQNMNLGDLHKNESVCN